MTRKFGTGGHRGALALVLVVMGGMLVGLAAPRAGASPRRAATASATPVSVFPRAGDREASPATTISFRDVAPAAIGPIAVRGSVSGVHSGTWIAHSDGRGASFRPAAPFTAGERVTVETQLDVLDATNGTFAFTVARPSPVEAVEHPDLDVPIAPAAGAARPATGAAPADTTDVSFRSRPDLFWPPVTVALSKPNILPGLYAVTPRGVEHNGPMLLDNRGHMVWDHESPVDNSVTDTKVVHYKGQDDLAWWEGELLGGHGKGSYHLVDNTYHDVATIGAGNGYEADLHDMQLTPANTALLLVYNSIAMDLTPYGGPADGSVMELVVQEIDLTTNAVLFEWHSLDDIPLTKSVQPVPTTAGATWDYVHGNAVALDNDGNLLISLRHTSSVVKVSRTTGHLVWTLGKGGDFTPSFAATEWFANQHDVRRRSDGTMSVFDNGSGAGPATRQFSRGFVMSVNETNRTVSLVRTLRALVDVKASSQSSFRELPNNHDVIGWGPIPEITQYFNNQPVLDLQMTANSYRAVLVDWHAHPTQPPDIAVDRSGGFTTAYASWNGATEVASWVMRAGPDAAHLATVATSARTGFETKLTAAISTSTIVVEARDAHGAVLGHATSVYEHDAGYWVLRKDGAVRAFGAATPFGNATSVNPRPVVGIAPAAGGGYWVAQSDGSVVGVSTASLGSMAGRSLAAPVVGIAGTPDGRGYWLVGRDGGIFTFGTARFAGSLAGRHLNGPIVGIAATPDGRGYTLVAADGGIFTFGTARFAGSLGGRHLNGLIVSLATTPDGHGYWLVGADGGVFTFGTAPFAGSLGARRLSAPIVAIAPTGNGSGYWLAGANGTVYNFGNAAKIGTGNSNVSPLVSIAAS